MTTTLQDSVTRRGFLTADDFQHLRQAAHDTHSPLLPYLVETGHLSRPQAAQVVADVTDMTYVDVLNYSLNAAAVALLPGDHARRLEALPLDFQRPTGAGKEELVIAVKPTAAADRKLRYELEEELQSLTMRSVHLVVADAEHLRLRCYQEYRIEENLDALNQEANRHAQQQSADIAETDTATDLSNSPALKFLTDALQGGASDAASDIHFDPGPDGLSVRYRIDGVLSTVSTVTTRALSTAVQQAVKTQSGIDLIKSSLPTDGRMTFTYEDRDIDVRVATMPTKWGEKMVLRLLDTTSAPMSMAELGLSEANKKLLDKALRRPNGLFVISGPVGAGKSSTSHVLIDSFNNPGVNIMTIEDPVERVLAGINQSQVDKEKGFTFSTALAAIVRCDPDIVLLGEIRDPTTAQIATETAMTGRRVVTTLHANDAPSSLTRLMGFEGMELHQVASTVRVVIAQRLLRRLCVHCRQPVTIDADDPFVASCGPQIPVTPERMWKAVGCTQCAQVGYRGRVAVHEIMLIDRDIENLIMAQTPVSVVRDAALAKGMVPLHIDAYHKVLDGITTVDEMSERLGTEYLDADLT